MGVGGVSKTLFFSALLASVWSKNPVGVGSGGGGRPLPWIPHWHVHVCCGSMLLELLPHDCMRYGTIIMLWFSFIFGLDFIFLCIGLRYGNWRYYQFETKKIKCKPRIKFSHNKGCINGINNIRSVAWTTLSLCTLGDKFTVYAIKQLLLLLHVCLILCRGRGLIVNVASAAGLHPTPLLSMYSGTKVCELRIW